MSSLVSRIIWGAILIYGQPVFALDFGAKGPQPPSLPLPILPEFDSGSEIHAYADSAACEMGARRAAYLPDYIAPTLPAGAPAGTPVAKDVPVFWNKRKVTWNNTLKEFMFTPITGGTPVSGSTFTIEEAWTKKKFNSPDGLDLKCDKPPHIAPSCLPGQKVYSINTPTQAGGQIRWLAVMRRQFKVATQSTLWQDDHSKWFDVVAIQAYKDDTYATIGFDTLATKASQIKRLGFTSGSVPVPGGLRPELRIAGVRASRYFDPPQRMGKCTNCHGTPFLGSEWIGQVAGLGLNEDEDRMYWIAGNDIVQGDQPKFVTYARFRTYPDSPGDPFPDKTHKCSGCHLHWAVNSITSPGGLLAGQYVYEGFPAVLDSAWRRGFDLTKLPNLVQASPTSYVRQTHLMPKSNASVSVADWNSKYALEYNMISCCTNPRANQIGSPVDCSQIVCVGDPAKDIAITSVAGSSSSSGTLGPGAIEAVRPVFFSQLMITAGLAPKVPVGAEPPIQLIQSPDEVEMPQVEMGDCPITDTGSPNVPGQPGVTLDTGDQCYRVRWQDSKENPWNAPREFYLETNAWKVGTPRPKLKLGYCPSGNKIQANFSEQIPGVTDAWRFKYEYWGVIKACQAIQLQLCGGWCGGKLQSNSSNSSSAMVVDENGESFPSLNGINNVTSLGSALPLITNDTGNCGSSSSSKSTSTSSSRSSLTSTSFSSSSTSSFTSSSSSNNSGSSMSSM
jgi:hypothetical protein